LIPEVEIYCFTCLEDKVRVNEMLAAGAVAYFDKSDLNGLLTAIAS
jgi:hypothetical protein